MKDFKAEWLNNETYFKMLGLMGSLSNLFSDSDIPFIHYRITENLFCKYFNAENLSRTDTAYDARIADLGVGIKTFQLKGKSSTEKIAEFNALSPELRNLNGEELAHRLTYYRNERMFTANRLYGISNQIYHIIGRRENELIVFNTPYELIDTDSIKVIKDTKVSLHFKDQHHEYTFNKSKSVLMKKFSVPEEFKCIDVKVIPDPYSLLENLLGGQNQEFKKADTCPFVLLPLYSLRKPPIGVYCNSEGKWVPLKSGLNQWNADGRPRDLNEVYIPIPAEVHRNSPGFFPERHVPFNLHLPDGNILNVKVCQTKNKGLMSNPNKALGEWILRKVLGLNQGELLTIDKLDAAGFDTVVVYKNHDKDYSIDVFYSSADNGLME